MDLGFRARAEEFGLRMNGPPGLSRRAVQGLDATLAALRAGLVSDLLLAGTPAKQRLFSPLRRMSRRRAGSGWPAQ